MIFVSDIIYFLVLNINVDILFVVFIVLTHIDLLKLGLIVHQLVDNSHILGRLDHRAYLCLGQKFWIDGCGPRFTILTLHHNYLIARIISGGTLSSICCSGRLTGFLSRVLFLLDDRRLFGGSS